MHDTYVARQPIFNARRQTLGYEILFRNGENNAFPHHIDSNRATYRLVAENFLSLGTNAAIRGSRCFINFPYQSLINRLPLSLPRQELVVEVLENCPPTDELYDALQELYHQGYMVALDDFVYGPQWERFLPFVQIIKIDIQELGIEAACDFVRRRLEHGCKRKYLAEKVETEQEFLLARSAGFHFFQGFFFSQPQLLKQRYFSPEHLIVMELFQEVCKPMVDFEKVENIVAKDVAVSYQLLKFVNAMSDRLEVSISSFRQALVYLGQDKLKTFVSLAVASFISAKKPRALYHLALQRAQFCLLMSRQAPFEQYRDQAFLIGLFSILDALLDLSLPQLVEQLPLSDEIKRALLEREGPLGQLLTIEASFEQGDWEEVERLCVVLGVDPQRVLNALMDAQMWSHQFTD
ncbi:EAL domain-containing protein [Vibrio sp. AK197]